MKNLDPDPDLESMDPDPESINPDPQHWTEDPVRDGLSVERKENQQIIKQKQNYILDG